jgi:hypothetical protein
MNETVEISFWQASLVAACYEKSKEQRAIKGDKWFLFVIRNR